MPAQYYFTITYYYKKTALNCHPLEGIKKSPSKERGGTKGTKGTRFFYIPFIYPYTILIYYINILIHLFYKNIVPLVPLVPLSALKPYFIKVFRWNNTTLKVEQVERSLRAAPF
jgi:hypothetical protein